MEDSAARGKTVLVVDPSPALLIALERCLTANGVHCLTASTSEDALQVLDSHVIHAVVSAEELPDSSGLHFLDEVGRAFRSIGRVLLAEYLEPYLESEAKIRGVVALDKSVPPEELLRVVNREIWTKRGPAA